MNGPPAALPPLAGVALGPARSPNRSLVAGVNALFRSREAEAPAATRLLHDPYARLFRERHALVWALRGLRWLLPPLRRLIDDLQIAHCVRHRSIDELCLQAAGRDGFPQIVLLGAGYDTRPLRLAAALPGVRWIEVDHPATAARKAHLWSRQPPPPPPAADDAPPAPASARVALDFTRCLPPTPDHTWLVHPLRAVGFDPDAPACFVLEGLAHYLPRPVLARLLGAAGAGPGRRRIILSFIRPEMARAAPPLFVTLVRLLREVPTTHLARDELAHLARASGLHLRDHYTFADQVRHLLPTPPRRTPRLTQDLATFDA